MTDTPVNAAGSPALIDHIAFLVPDLEEAILWWSAATGCTFSPIARYRTSRWSDRSDPELHDHDARISFSKEGPPRIELMEVTGEGALGAAEIGPHHLGFAQVRDVRARMARLAAIGVGDDGWSFTKDGTALVAFTERSALDGIRLEMVSPLPGPIVADDGSLLPLDPATGRTDLWAPR
ncbi:VOC family protein [Georgenia thermotolerans]|uniref:VOC family protein n=1 Tax=Georgenia thermotolerans TaxID=527326 RepID=UPI001478B92B|nr:VOC family protein [Georgenia thermotolerans]